MSRVSVDGGGVGVILRVTNDCGTCLSCVNRCFIFVPNYYRNQHPSFHDQVDHGVIKVVLDDQVRQSGDVLEGVNLRCQVRLPS